MGEGTPQIASAPPPYSLMAKAAGLKSPALSRAIRGRECKPWGGIRP
jgi:hypothetical protein